LRDGSIFGFASHIATIEGCHSSSSVSHCFRVLVLISDA
jgi:hypothetical protein